MLTNGGHSEGLFRAGFMVSACPAPSSSPVTDFSVPFGHVQQSGSPIPVGDITHGQGDYDSIVSAVNCTQPTNFTRGDTLACLRTVPLPVLSNAINATPGRLSYQSLRRAWVPRVDDKFLKAPPQELVVTGSVATVPFISGDCDDEGT